MSDLLMDDRQQRIMEILAIQGTITVSELSETFDVSNVTIRNDLNQLAEQGQVVRTHGGARLAGERTRQEFTYTTRQRINAYQKRCIGDLAATMVKSGEAILLDASTTAIAVGQALKRRNNLDSLTVVTTGIWTALEMLGAPGFNIVLAGGYVHDTSGSITGTITNEILGRFNFSKAFMGAWGISIQAGLTDSPLVEVDLKRAIIPRCQEVIAVVDSSKFGKLGLATFATIDQISHVVTDENAPADIVANLCEFGLDVQIACQDEGNL